MHDLLRLKSGRVIPPIMGGAGEGDPPPADPPADPPPADPPADPPPQDPQADPDPKPPWGSDDEFDPEKAWKLLQNVRGDLDKTKKARDDLAAKIKEHEDKDKTEAQRLAEERDELAQKVPTLSQETARLRVALRKGLTETQAKRLVGDSEEELEADADELLASFTDANGQEPHRRPRERLRPGAAPAAEPEPSPDQLADAIEKRARGY